MDDLESDEKLQSYIINLKDLMNTSAPLGNGCCGQDGMDGLNTTCIHGHKIGTENSDCWMPHSFVFDKSCINVEWINEIAFESNPIILNCKINDGSIIIIETNAGCRRFQYQAVELMHLE